jgi:hypothetical protein
MEVGHPIRPIAIGDAGGFEVGLNQEVGVFGQVAEDGLSRGLGRKPGAEGFGQVGADRLNVIPTTLGVGGGHGDGRGFRIQEERLGGQGPQLIGPESGPEGQAVEGGPVGAERLQDDRTGFGGFDETRLFVGGQIPSLVSSIRVGIRAGQVGQLVFPDSAVPPEPL